jgi:DNA-binding Lrp family transcriptional regulator
MIDEIDKKIINRIQGDLPLTPQPFAEMAKDINISEDQFIEKVNNLIRKGIIRRFGATLRHQEAGYSSNAMVAWVVPEESIENTGEMMSEFREVSHCYQRRPQNDWKYNLFTMVHADSKEECYEIAKRISEKTGMEDYTLLFSEKEFKKTSMEYF